MLLSVNMSEGIEARKNKTMRKKERSISAREQERLKARQQKYLNALDDLATLRDHYKRELTQKLEKKVNKQRKKMREKKKKEEQKKERQEQSSHSLSTCPPSLLAEKGNDDAFHAQVKVTQIHRILRIQNVLEKQGQLKYKTDEDELWNILCEPDNLRIVEEEISKGGGTSLSIRKIKQILKENRRSMTNRSMEEEVSESDLYRLHGRAKVAFQSESRRDASADKIDRLLPKVQPPKFQILFKDIITWRNPNEGRLFQLAEERRERRLRKQQKMKEMYEHSMAYKDATGRLLKKYRMGPYDEARNMLTFSSAEDTVTPIREEQPRARSPVGLKERKPSTKEEEEHFNWVLMDEVGRRVTTRSDLFPKIRSPVDDSRMHSALTIEAVEENSVIRVTSKMSQMWVNPKR